MSGMTDETIEETAGLHVLGVLSDKERQAVADRMADDPALQQAVAAWSRRLAPMLDTVPGHAAALRLGGNSGPRRDDEAGPPP